MTLGPSSSSAEEIATLTRAGMDVARINLSHGDRTSHSELIKNIKKVRKKLGYHTAILLDTRGPEIRIGHVADAIKYASCATAADLHAGAIVTVTSSGSTARKVAMYRPASPVIAASSVKKSFRKLQLVRGVASLFCKSGSSMEKQIKNGLAAALLHGLLDKGDTIVITAGLPLHTPGTTNILRVHTLDQDAHLTSEKGSKTVYISKKQNYLPIPFTPKRRFIPM